MKNKPIKLGLLAAALAGSAALVQAQTTTLFTGTYSQTFDSLGTTSVAWTNDSTLDGWTINSENFVGSLGANTGSTPGGALYNFGSSGGPDRALGYIGAGANDRSNFFLGLTNATSQAIHSLTVSYSGELWRSGGMQPADSNNTLRVFYAIGTPALVATNAVTGWTAVDSLTYAPLVSVAAGFQSGVGTSLSVTLTGLNIAIGDSVYLRGLGNDGSGTDAGLAIDNVSVSAASAIPEPSSYAAIFGGAALAGAAVVRRRRALLATGAA